MDVREIPITDVIPYENNPRINDDAVEYVANSIREFRFKQPIVCDADMVVIVGHTRLKAAQQLGLETVPVLIADDLTPEQVKAYRLADNKTAEFAEWDYEKLVNEISFIPEIDVCDFGFDVFKELEQAAYEEEIERELDAEVEGEVPFANYIDEANNYVVLKFKTEQEWLQAQSILGLQRVRCLPSDKSGKISNAFLREGIGRVVDGVAAFKKIHQSMEQMNR